MIPLLWRLVFVDGTRCLLVHVDGQSEADAELSAREKIARDNIKTNALRLRSAERVE